MADNVSGKGDGPGWLPFDLLGNPVPANKGKRGRPQHAYDPEIFESLIRCFAMGWPQTKVASAHGMSVPTMNAHYFSTDVERKARSHAVAIYEAELLARLDRQSREGKVAATDKLLKHHHRAQLGPQLPVRPKAKKLGKKEQRRQAAHNAGLGSEDWGELIGPAAGNA